MFLIHWPTPARDNYVDTWKGLSGDNLARHVVVHPRRPKAYVSHIRSRTEIIDGGGSIFPHVTVYDLVPPGPERRTSFGMDTYNGVYVVTNPWESALSPDGKRLYTIYAGTNDMNVSEVIDDDYREGVRPMRLRNLRVVAFVQDDESADVLAALEVPVKE